MATVTFDGTGLFRRQIREEIARVCMKLERRKPRSRRACGRAGSDPRPNRKGNQVYVGDELQAEFAERKQSEDKKRRAHLGAFLKFKEYCAGYSPPLPHLPAAPAAIAAFLTSEMEKGQGHLNRLCAAIAVMHKRVDLPDPTNDPLVRAVVRLAHKDKSSPPAANPS